jgi:HEAT repeat protein
MTDEPAQPGRMLDLIRSKSFEGRKALVDELRREPTPRSVAMLIEMLNDESWSLRELAVSALATTPEKLSGPPLMDVVVNGLWYSRAAAARALGRLGYLDALPRLLSLLTETNRTITDDAVRALIDMARRGRAVAVARGIVSLDRDAEAALVLLERLDPDSGRKVRILVAREEISSPVKEWLRSDDPDPGVLAAEHLHVTDDEMDVTWESISGPVGG